MVLYCAENRDYGEGILTDFTSSSGLTVAPKFNAEAKDSIGLYEEIVRNAKRPRCGVFWNNEVFNSIRLQRLGLLEPYESPAAAGFPDDSKAWDRSWQAFAARPRVLLINTHLIADDDRPDGIFDLVDPKWRGKIAMADPRHGTTATEAACLFEVLGAEKAKEYFRALKANEVVVVAGNKQAAQAVSSGQVAMALTDSDDAIGELNGSQPVAIILPDRDGDPDHPQLGTLFIPNTVMIVKGAPNSAGARRLVDYLLSPEVERRLAEGGRYQVPLNPAVKANIHPALARPEDIKAMSVDWDRAADLWDDVQAFLKDEFAR